MNLFLHLVTVAATGFLSVLLFGPHSAVSMTSVDLNSVIGEPIEATCMDMLERSKSEIQETRLRRKRWAGAIMGGGGLFTGMIGTFMNQGNDGITKRMKEDLDQRQQKLAGLEKDIDQMRDVNGQLIVKSKEQAAQLMYLKNRLGEMEAQGEAQQWSNEQKLMTLQQALEEFKNMSEATTLKIMQEYDMLEKKLEHVLHDTHMQMQSLNEKLDLQHRLIDSRLENIQGKLASIEAATDQTNARQEDLANHLAAIEMATVQVGDELSMPTQELASTSCSVADVNSKAARLITALDAHIVTALATELSSSAKLLKGRRRNSTLSNNLRRTVDMRQQQDMHDRIIKFSKSVDRLHYLMHYRDTKLRFDRDSGIWSPPDLALHWSRLCLNGSRSNENIDNILLDFEYLTIVDHKTPTGHKSIYEVYQAGIAQFLRDHRRRAAFTQQKLNELVNTDPVQSEAFYLQVLFAEMQDLVRKATEIQSQAEAIAKSVPKIQAIVTLLKTPPESNVFDQVEEGSDHELPAPLGNDDGDDDLFENRRRRRREAEGREQLKAAFIEKQREQAINETNEFMLNQTYKHCVKYMTTLAKQRSYFQYIIVRNADSSFKSEPVFYTYRKDNGTTEIGFDGVEEVPVAKRSASIRQAYIKVAAQCPASVPKRQAAKVNECRQVISGCRFMCMNPSSSGCKDVPSNAREQVTMQCAFRSAAITDALTASHVDETLFPANDSEVLNSTVLTRANNNANGEGWLQRFLEKEPPIDHSFESKRVDLKKGAMYAITGMLRVDDPDKQTVCGVKIGQPTGFAYDLVSLGVSALSIDIGERVTGRFVKTKPIPKEGLFGQHFKPVRVGAIHTSWIKPKEPTWITGIGFSTTGFQHDTLTMQLETSLF